MMMVMVPMMMMVMIVVLNLFELWFLINLTRPRGVVSPKEGDCVLHRFEEVGVGAYGIRVDLTRAWLSIRRCAVRQCDGSNRPYNARQCFTHMDLFSPFPQIDSTLLEMNPF